MIAASPWLVGAQDRGGGIKDPPGGSSRWGGGSSISWGSVCFQDDKQFVWLETYNQEREDLDLGGTQPLRPTKPRSSQMPRGLP